MELIVGIKKGNNVNYKKEIFSVRTKYKTHGISDVNISS